MELRDVGHVIGDLARLGLVVARKAVSQSLADERAVLPQMVGELVGRIHPRRMKARVAEIQEETFTTKTFRLRPVDEPFPPFRAGQFVNLFLAVDGVHTSRPYTISSSPTRRAYIDITVRKMTNGFVSQYLCDRAAVGDQFELSDPAGCFYHDPIMDTGQLLFLAGGCGITPFMSMIRNEADTKQNLDMHLIYGSRVPNDVIFRDELEGLASVMRNLKVDVVISEPPDGYSGLTGFLDAQMIERLVGDVEDKTFFVCGPHAMYKLCLDALEKLGIPRRRVKRELSGPLPDITLVEGWPEKLDGQQEFTVTIEGGPGPFRVRCGEPLLNSLERNQSGTDALCRSGECGACRARLVRGEVFMPPAVSLRRSDAIFGYIHPCAAYPMSDITIRL
jgi:ferredoxin-NADP reductase